MKNLYILLLLLNLALVIRAQQINLKTIPIFQSSPAGPAIDSSNWVLDTLLSDEFNDTTGIDSTKWDYVNICDHPTILYSAVPIYYTKRDVIEKDGAHLILPLEKSNGYSDSCYYVHSTWAFLGGEIESKNRSYQYGYYEISAKLPGFYDPNQGGKPMGLGFWPAFWIFYGAFSRTTPCCDTVTITQPCCEHKGFCDTLHDEVDILEPNGWDYVNADVNNYGLQDEYGPLAPCGAREILTEVIQSSDPLFNNYHKYGLELQSDRIYFYFDDQPYGWQYVNPRFTLDTVIHALKMQNMSVVIGMQMSNDVYQDSSSIINNYNYSVVLSDSIAPATTLYVDYFHYYKLKPSACDSAVTIYNNTDLNNFTFGLRKTITFDGTINTNTTSTNNNVFRAVDEIDIKPGFEAPSGSILDLNITPCDN